MPDKEIPNMKPEVVDMSAHVDDFLDLDFLPVDYTVDVDGGSILPDYLAISQPTSKIMTDETNKIPLGEFYFAKHPTTVLGKTVVVLPISYVRVWFEVKKVPGKNLPVNVAIHEPDYTNDIDKSDYGNWILPNGNSIREACCFILIMKGFEYMGPVIFMLRSTSIKAAKCWYTQLMQQRYPNNNKKLLPFFGRWWTIKVGAAQSSDAGTWFPFDGAIPEQYINEDFFLQNVKEVVPISKRITNGLLAFDGAIGQTEPETEEKPDDPPPF